MVPTIPPIAIAVVRRPKPDLVHPESLSGVQDQHRPGRPVRDVERQDGQGQGPHRRVRHEPADALDHLRAQAAPLPRSLPGPRHHPRHQHRAEGETCGVRREWQEHADGEQERADRRGQELVGEDERALHPGVRDAQVLAGDETRYQRAARGVREVLRRPEDEQDDQDDRDVDGTRDDHRHQSSQDDRATDVHHDDHPLAVEPVRQGPAEDAEEQGRQVFAQQRHGDQEWIERLRRDEQWPGRDHDAVADVVDDRRGQEPAEAPPEPPRRDGLGQPLGRSHAGEGTNAQTAAVGLGRPGMSLGQRQPIASIVMTGRPAVARFVMTSVCAPADSHFESSSTRWWVVVSGRPA